MYKLLTTKMFIFTLCKSNSYANCSKLRYYDKLKAQLYFLSEKTKQFFLFSFDQLQAPQAYKSADE